MPQVSVHDFLGQLSAEHKAVEASSKGQRNGYHHYQLGNLRANKRHRPAQVSGDAAIFGSSELMNARMREMFSNNGKIKRPIELCRDLIVGQGINTYADPIDYTFGCFLDRRKGEIRSAFDYALQSDEEFTAWANDPQRCDVKGKQSFFQMQRSCVTEAGQVGDAIIKIVFTQPERGEVPFKLQMIEREQLDCSRDIDQTSTGGRILNGIEFDADGFEIGMWVYSSHPYGIRGGFNFESTFIPQSMYVHYFKKNRPSQHIGVTWGHAAGIPVFRRGEWLQTELKKQVRHSQHVLAKYSDNAGTFSLPSDFDDGDHDPSTPVAMGYDLLAVDLAKDDKLELLESQGPAANTDKLVDILDVDAANSWNLSPYTYTGKTDRVNQSSLRGAMQLESSQMAPLQMGLGLAVVLPVRRLFNRLAIVSGIVDFVSPAQYTKEQRRYDRFDCIGPGRILLDAEMEIDAALAKLRGGLSTLKIECGRLGLNYMTVLRQIKLERVMAGELGIQLDQSKGNGGQPGERKNADSSDSLRSALQSLANA